MSYPIEARAGELELARRTSELSAGYSKKELSNVAVEGVDRQGADNTLAVMGYTPQLKRVSSHGPELIHTSLTPWQ